MTIAALIVTSSSERWIEQTLSSVLRQDRPADYVLVVDDNSTDSTRSIARGLLGDRGRVVQALTTARDITTRVADNFRQGLAACADADVVVLGDHDDIWHADRIARQAGILDSSPEAIMVASDGRLVDDNGAALGGTLRTAFPVPARWAQATPGERMRIALRWSLATGGASAVRPIPLAQQGIPAGWLHDRWWSLAATAMEAFVLDDAQVIDYRVSPEQQVGLARGQQAKSTPTRAWNAIRQAPRTAARINDVQRLRAVATEATVAELSGARLLRNFA